MANWAIGDVHGCWLTLARLLEEIEWQPWRDRLWLVGDLVNRGPASLEVLRWAHAHRHSLLTVLGNHDLHLVARACGASGPKPTERLEEILGASDRNELVEWLAGQPLVHHEGGRLLVHAGLWPGWSLEEALELGRRVSARLAGPERVELLAAAGRFRSRDWRRGLEGLALEAAALAMLTKIRTVRRDGSPCLSYTGAAQGAPEGCRPWFELSQALGGVSGVVFGHWASLGLYRDTRVCCLDAGCVYGGWLTALCLDDGRVRQLRRLDP